MRLERLEIPSFGPFTGLDLAFPAEHSDFHIIYGPNEAGESSLLRAVRDLLYGIHGQTPDSFLHPYSKLKIGATISNSGGRCLSFQRRKGNRQTLLAEDGSALPDDALTDFLGIVDRHFFTTLFGLGSEELREGSEALLHGQGDLGQALFSASLAGTPIHRILAALDGESRTLFDGRARVSVSIRPAVSGYEEMIRQSKTAVVRPEAWEDTLRQLGRLARSNRDRCDEELRASRTRRGWIQRCLDTLPTLGQLAESETRLAALSESPNLSPDFVADCESAMAERDQVGRTLAESTRAAEQLKLRINENRPHEGLLVRAPSIESVHQRLAVYREWKADLERMTADRTRAEIELQTGIRDLGFPGQIEDLEELRIRTAEEQSLREVARQLDSVSTELRKFDETTAKCRREHDKLSLKLSALSTRDVSELRSALAQTAAATEAAAALPQKRTSRNEALNGLNAQHGLLPGAPDDHRRTFELPVPGAARLRQFEAEATQIDSARKRLEDVISETGHKTQQIRRQLERLERRGALPDVATLHEARQDREGLWHRVLAAWREDRVEETIDDGQPLAEAYSQAVRFADEIADRLRVEAEAVSQAEELRSQLRDLDINQTNARSDVQNVEAVRTDWESRWQATWFECSVSPASPAEMLEWRDQWIDFRSRFETWEAADLELSAARAEVESAESLLAPLLPNAGKTPLSALQGVAMRQVRAADEAQGARGLLQVQQTELEANLKELANRQHELSLSVEQARKNWKLQCRVLGLPDDASTESVMALLEGRRQLVTNFDAWSSLGLAIEGKCKAISDYEAEVHTLGDYVGIAGGEVEAREEALWTAVGQARAQKARQQQARSDLEKESERGTALQLELNNAESRVADALAISASAGEAGLQSLLTTLKARHVIDTRIAELRKSLHGSARGEPLDAFIERVRAEQGDSLAGERDQLDQTLTTVEAERDQALRELARAEREKSELEQAGADASGSLQAARNAATAIRHDALRYLRLRLAIQFLNEQVEQFRSQNQAPLLTRASELFRAITEGSFENLGTAFGEDDKPLLVGLRDGKEVGIPGMSDGTRDQLYLALRLAAIERHLIQHEPMPIVLDDLLASFDDRRCRSILPILHELGTRTQVMLFTHHRHLVDLAQAVLRDGALHVLELGSNNSGADAVLRTGNS